MDFLEKVDFLMSKNGLNKNTLSKACGIPYTTIDGWYKKGYEGLKLTTLRKLSNCFKVPLDYWVEDEYKYPEHAATLSTLNEEIPKYKTASESLSLDDYVKSRGATDLELEILRKYFEMEPSFRVKFLANFMGTQVLSEKNELSKSELDKIMEEADKAIAEADNENISKTGKRIV